MRWSGAVLLALGSVDENASYVSKIIIRSLRFPVLHLYQSLFELIFLSQQFVMFRLQFDHQVLRVDNRKIGFFRFLSYGGIDIHFENQSSEFGYSFEARNPSRKFSDHIFLFLLTKGEAAQHIVDTISVAENYRIAGV